MKIEESIQLAHLSKKNGEATEREKRHALKEAQAARVTYTDYLRAHLSLEITEDNSQLAHHWSLQQA